MTLAIHISQHSVPQQSQVLQQVDGLLHGCVSPAADGLGCTTAEPSVYGLEKNTALS